MFRFLKRIAKQMTGNVPVLDLEPYREQLTQSMTTAVEGFDGESPITRVDVWYDLVSMDVPMVRLYLDTHPTGEPCSGTSETFDLMELEFESWADACQSDVAKVKYTGNQRTVDDEESLCEIVGLFLLEVILSLRDAGVLSTLPCAEKCYIGVATYDGVWGWPDWNDRGNNDMVPPGK